MSVTELVEDLEVSAELVALMLTVLGDGREAGAEYLPEESMVPSAEEPPAVSSTDQVTAELEMPETVAEKEAELPTRTLAVEGETATVMEAVGGGGVLEVEEAEPQAAREKDKKSNVAQRAGEGARIGSFILGGGEGEDNWTEGQKRGKGVSKIEEGIGDQDSAIRNRVGWHPAMAAAVISFVLLRMTRYTHTKTKNGNLKMEDRKSGSARAVALPARANQQPRPKRGGLQKRPRLA
jgi:hypothetical protein